MIIKSALFTSASGSLGGMTAFQSKGNQILRARVVPIQPNTQAQEAAKNSFSAASSIYSSLTPAEKTAWNQWALTGFNPRFSTNVGQMSGANAFVAIQTIFNTAMRLPRTYDLEVNGAALPGGDTRLPFLPPSGYTPISSSAPAWDNGSGGSESLTVMSATLTNTGQVGVVFQVGDGTGTDMSNFYNPYGDQFGIAIFCSNGNPQANMSYQRPEQYCLGYFQPAVATTEADLDAVETVSWQSTNAFDIARYLTFPLSGQYANLTFYTVTQGSQMDRIGSLEVLLTT